MEHRSNTALVLGATGGIGGEVARLLQARGWTVRALRRGGAADDARDGLTWLRGDAMNREDVMRGAEGCSVIVHAVNPPGYRAWDKLVLPMVDNTVAAATALEATIVLPGTVYNFGPDAWPLLAEDSPQHPVTRKGAIRVALEQRLEQASRRGARVIVVRAGDFFGPRPGNNWFSLAMVKPGRPVRSIANPASPGIGHQWAYLPDVARTMVALLDRRDELAPFERFHMAGHWDDDGMRMADAIRRVVGRSAGTAPRIRAVPWGWFRLAAPFVTTLRELQEMRYLWRQPLRMVNHRLIEVLGEEPHTPLEQAVRASLSGLGCLPGHDDRRAPASSPGEGSAR
ncbi:NAD-dependent epimerase/dehydratase family protein [Thiomonas sp.]|uniref:NAD-dependent epimerase/dehydratase family protein n=1 Tax=Thiomonas sp. TaxID=2047785 RepID=UPI00260AB372|nr:NAD-dependent epimerase/dehydratase family protein [Thiomonas sp.]